MECKTIAFDDHHLLLPKKVDTVWTDFRLKLERWESGNETEAQHLGFQDAFGLFGVETPMIQHVSDAGDAGSSLAGDFKQRTPS